MDLTRCTGDIPRRPLDATSRPLDVTRRPLDVTRRPLDGTRRSVLFIFLFGLVVHGAAYQQDVIWMRVHEEIHVLHPGQAVELVCEFYMDYFDMFQNPIVWQKVQLGETTPINVMSNVMSPFAETGKFNVTFLDNKPEFKIVLRIAGVSFEDYGNYTCEVRGPQTTVLASLMHYLFVKAPVHSLSISDSIRTIQLDDNDRVLNVNENVPMYLSCKSVGGCPPPDMSVSIGKRTMTQQFNRITYSRFSGSKGLRVIEHVTESKATRFRVSADYDDQLLKCQVIVPGLGSNIASVRLKVIYAPIIKCETTHANKGQKNVTLVCEVRSRPPTTSLFWIIDQNGTTVVPGHQTNEYWNLNMLRNDGKLETRLFIKHVTIKSFRTYKVMAENTIGRTTHEIRLLQKHQLSLPQSVLQNPNGNTSHNPQLSSRASSPKPVTSERFGAIYLLVSLTAYITTCHTYQQR